MLFVCLISGNSLRHIVLDVIIEDRVVILVEAFRSGKLYHFVWYSSGVCHDRATSSIHLGVSTDVANLSFSGLLIHNK